MNEIVLQGRGICKSYGSKRNRRQVLFDVDVDVYEGECLAIIGASIPASSTEEGIQPLVEVEKEVIQAALEKTGGNKTEAARQLGITRKTLLAKLSR